LDDTETELDIIFHHDSEIIEDTADFDYTYTVYYVPGFQMIIPIIVLAIFSIGYMFKRKR